MEFRTPIDTPARPVYDIRHDEGIVMLGSCFTDNVGALLETDGFRVTHNPMGPLYNPQSIANAIRLALSSERSDLLTVRQDPDGRYHCLDFASRYVADTAEELLNTVNAELDMLAADIRAAKTIILTLGTAYVFRLTDSASIVGNCHKFSNNMFSRERLSVVEIRDILTDINSMLPGKTVIYTVSPIRHIADGMHGNQLSKSSLLMAVDMAGAMYFPAYEIMMDDLRDYRFYASDMKHPSPVAVDYIYEVFGKYYFSNATVEKAAAARRQTKRLAHRQILKQ